jgi:hypothetical protein
MGVFVMIGGDLADDDAVSAGEKESVTQAFQPAGRSWLSDSA